MPEPSSSYQQFQTLAASVAQRLYERSAADAALFRLMTAHSEFRLQAASEALCKCSGADQVLDHHRKLVHERTLILDAEYSRDTVIVAMTLLDSFVTDVTRFLLLLRPTAVPKDRQIRVGELFEAADYPTAIDVVVSKYLNELAYRPLRERLTLLHEKFGVTLPDEPSLKRLDAVALLRNDLVHNVSRFTYTPGDSRGSVRISMRELPAVAWDMAEQSLNTVVHIVKHILQSVARDVFKRESDGPLMNSAFGTER